MQERHTNFIGLRWLLVLIGCLNLLDFLATQSLVVNGEHAEGNPLMGVIIDTPYFALVKLVAIPLGLVFLWIVRRHAIKQLSLLKLTSLTYLTVVAYTWIVFYL